MAATVDALLGQGGPAPRADALRNAERLVAAARAALDEQGLGVTTRQVADRAGVGLGTLYRRVPSLSALLTAILTDTIREMTDQATAALEDPDAWHGFASFAETFVQLRATSCGLHDALGGGGAPQLDGHISRLQLAIGRLIRRSQAAGAIRDDLDWRDIPFVLATAIPAGHTIGLTARPDQWHRNLRIILDGLQPHDPSQPRPAAAG